MKKTADRKKKVRVNFGRILVVALAVIMVIQLMPVTAMGSGGTYSNFELQTTLSAANPNAVPTGEAFNLSIAYTFKPLGGVKYGAPTIMVQVPAGMKVRELITAGNPDVKNIEMPDGTVVANPSVVEVVDGEERTTYIKFQLNNMGAGSSQRVSAALYYPNMTTPDRTTGTIVTRLTAEFNGQSNTLTSTNQVTAAANEPWKVTKDWGTLTGETFHQGALDKSDTDYTVTYKITAESDTNTAPYIRGGKLDFLSYSLKDTFPAAAAVGSVNGYPAGGDALLMSVSMTDPASGRKVPLAETTDYVVTKDANGAITDIEFLTYAKYGVDLLSSLEPGNVVTPHRYDIPVKSEYFVTVKYPRAAYQTPTNEEMRRYALTDTAALNYTLVGNVPGTGSDSETVTLGEHEVKKNPHEVIITKNVSIGSIVGPLNESAQKALGNASFYLYDSTYLSGGRVLAKDIDGRNTVTAAPRFVDTYGKLTFSNLREGVYYLYEQSGPAGFSLVEGNGHNYLKMEVLADGTVKINDGASVPKGNVVITNKSDADGKGAMQLTKIGVSAGGASEALDGVRFELRSNPADSTTMVASGSTDLDGSLMLYGVTPGSYWLVETSIPDEWTDRGYELPGPASAVRVTIQGDTVTTVESGDAGYPDKFVNRSPYGKFTLKKMDGSTAIAGARFALYDNTGAGGTAGGIVADYADFTVPVGGFESGLLPAGTYHLKELEAPTGYKLNTGFTTITVANNTTRAYAVQNEKLGRLAIMKYGKWGSDPAHSIGIAGVSFYVYKGADQETSVRLMNADNTPVVLVSAAGAGNPIYQEATGEFIRDASVAVEAGSYWLEEIPDSVPPGYAPITGKIGNPEGGPFVVDPGIVPVTEAKVYNEPTYGKLSITKQNARDAATKIGGVEFWIYRASAYGAGEDIADLVPEAKITTNKDNGYAETSLLEPGVEYVIVEKNTPAGYVALPEAIRYVDSITHVGYAAAGTGRSAITVPARSAVNVIINNDPLVGIEIIKKDSAQNADGGDIYIDGAVFRLYNTYPANLTDTQKDEAQYYTEGTTATVNGSKGRLLFGDLMPGQTYWLVERSAPGYPVSGEVLPITAPTTADATPKQVTVTNDRPATLVVHKHGMFDMTNVLNLSGVVFEVYPKRPGSTDAAADKTAAIAADTLKTTYATGADGYTRLAGLAPGTYWVAETKDSVPNGFTISAPQSITLASGDNTTGYRVNELPVKNKANKGKVRVRKVNSKSANRGLEAVFHLYAEDPLNPGSYPKTDPPAGTITTEAGTNEGYGTSGYLAPGNYEVVEVSVEDEYTIDKTTRIVKVIAGETTGLTNAPVFKNPPKGRIQVLKTAAWTGGIDNTGLSTTVGGVVFELAPKKTPDGKGDMGEAKKNPAASGYFTMETEAGTGLATSGYLDADVTYWVHEFKLPPGAEDDYALNDTYYQVTVSAPNADPANAANITVQRVDNMPKKGRIEIVKLDAANERTRLSRANFELWVVDDSFMPVPEQTIQTSGGPQEVRIVKDPQQTGFTLQTDPNGTVRTVALDPSKTYYLKEVSAPPDYTMQYEWHGPINIDPKNPQKIVMQTVLNYKPATAGGSKVDNAGVPVAGAVIALFETEGDAEAVNDALLDGTVTLTSETDAMSLDYWNKDHSYNVLQIVKSTDSGFAFEGLQPNTTYYVVELLPPSGYVRDKGVHDLELDANGTTAPDNPVVIVNERYGWVSLAKVTTLNETTFRLNGAEFAIYNAKLKPGDTEETNAEIKDPDPQIPSSDVPHKGHVCDGVSCPYEIDGDALELKESGQNNLDGAKDLGGGLTFMALPPGDYIIKETKPPTGFEADTKSYHVRVYAGEENRYLVTNPIENEADYGRFTVVKHDEADPDGTYTLLEAEFKVEVETSPGTWEPYLNAGKQMTFSTKSGPVSPLFGDANYASGYMPSGHYRIIETGVQEGYTPDATSVDFYITAGEITLNVEKTNAKQGGLQFTKFSRFSADSDYGTLKDVEFRLYHYDTGLRETDIPSDWGDFAYHAISSDTGAVMFSNADAGRYWLVEYNNPTTGYANNTPVVLKDDIEIAPGETLKLEDGIVNAPVYGKLKIYKEDDKANPHIALEGAKFTIYKEDPSDKDAAWLADANNVAGRMETDENGYAVSGLLPQGHYFLLETEAPDGYLIRGTGIYPKEGPGFAVEANRYNSAGKPDIVIGNDKAQTVTIVKTMSDTADSPGLVDFALYLSLADAEAHRDHGTVPAKYYTATTDGDGKAVFTDLLPNTTYYLRETSVPVGYVDRTQVIEQVTTDNTGAKEKMIQNVKKGRIQIKKVAQWTDSSGTSLLPLPDVRFDIYRLDGEGDRIQPKVGTMQTVGQDGIATSDWLDPADYELEEDASSLYGHFSVSGKTVSGKTVAKVTVKSGETNVEYRNDPILNVAARGRIQVYKYAQEDANDPASRVGLEGGAVFGLYQRTENGYVSVGTIETGAGGIYSGYLDLGEYMMKEVKPPTGYSLDETEYTFELTEAGHTVYREVPNKAQAKLVLTKYTDDLNGNKPMAGVSFQLYHGTEGNPGEKEGGVRVTDASGVIEWIGLDAGDYVIEELTTSATYGYEPRFKYIEVEIVGAGKAVTHTVSAYNKATHGRLLVKKEDSKGDALAGAVFEVYAVDGDKKPVGQAIGGSFGPTSKDGLAFSRLLPVDDPVNGTWYYVKEIQAPTGYTLNDQLNATSALVRVKPIHAPGEGGETNYVKFVNTRVDELGGFATKINKDIKFTGPNSAVNPDSPNHIDSPQGLMQGDVGVTFVLNGYADGKNPLPYETFTVTDQNITMYYNDENIVEQPKSLRNGDYTIDKVHVYGAADKEGTRIDAFVEYKAIGSAEWEHGGRVENLDELYAASRPSGVLLGETVDLSGKGAMAVQIRYVGVGGGTGTELIAVGKEFFADGIDLDAVFYKTAEGPNVHEIRRIENQATLDYTHIMTNNEGVPETVSTGLSSDEADVALPGQNVAKVKVQLTTTVTNKQDSYFPGEDVYFRTVGTNKSPDKDLISPILSVDMPAWTLLKTTGANNGISVALYDPDTRISSIIPAGEYVMDIGQKTEAVAFDVETGTYVPVIDPATGRPVMVDKMAFTFPGLALKPGQEIRVSYVGTVSTRLPRSVGALTTRAHLSSAHRLPVSYENPLGIAFEIESESEVIMGGLTDNTGLDTQVDQMYAGMTPPQKGPGKNKYLNAYDTINTKTAENLLIQKEVRGPLDADFIDPDLVAYTYPSGDLEYRLTLTNNNADEYEVSMLRMVDVLPFVGDRYVVRQSDTGAANSRSTELPGRMTLADVTAPAGTAVYCYVDEDWSAAGEDDWAWANREKLTPQEELPMLYTQGDAAWTQTTWWSLAGRNGKWVELSEVKAEGKLDQVTAIGLQYDYPTGGYLEPGESYSATVQLKAPGFTAEQIDQFYDKLIANSVGSAVVMGDKSADPNAAMAMPIENKEVLARLRLPTGSIGDYVWWDKNSDGLQDATDEPLIGVPVTLHQTTYTVSGDAVTTTRTMNTLAATAEHGSGWYLFDNLPCNLPKSGAEAGSRDPADYVGNTYYEYRLVFGDPSVQGGTQYAPTLRNIGNDDAADSDVDRSRVVDGIVLNVQTDTQTGVLTGEDNMTYDAGFIVPAALGDRVWFDRNKDGIQGPDHSEGGEYGVNGVTVNLYRVADRVVNGATVEEAEDTPLMTMLTRPMPNELGVVEDGMYLFDGLPNGKYRVEFDIGGLVKQDGYTYEYAFTAPKRGDASSRDDSDALEIADPDLYNADGRIRRTDTVTLAANQTDRRWDAGLTVYSAIGGYCFDDQNYNDAQDVGIPLPGTKAELYLYDPVTGALGDQPIRTTTVGDDGTYYFDFLEEGKYKVYFDFPDKYVAVDPHVGGDPALDSNVSETLSPDRNTGWSEDIELAADEASLHWDAGAYLLGGIGDYVWFDKNRDGVQDADELPVEGVQMTLQMRRGAEGEWVTQEDTVTDADGRYWFDELEGGLIANRQYRTVFMPPDETLEFTISYAGSDTALDSNALPVFIDGLGYPTDPVLLGYGEEDPTWDAGLIEVTGALGDYVWYDNNQNGIQEESEAGVEGVRIVLEYNVAGDVGQAASWREVGEQTTNGEGFYRFYDLREGFYRVTFYLPETYTVTSLENTDLNQLYMVNGQMQPYYAADSDAIKPVTGASVVANASSGGTTPKFVTRSIYLSRESTDWTWDGGIYRATDRPPTEIVPRQVYIPGGTRYVRSVRTGDESALWLWVLLAAAAGAAIVFVGLRGRVVRKRGRAYVGRH